MQSPAATARTQRCAVYTRKSAQAPIGQEVTSLESQRAICSSYIASQQHKGWLELPKAYDDGGRSGANLDRPALQVLLEDVQLGSVDVVVVYKLDRITRTLLDFVRLIDLFDRYGVVFVSITQNFDTGDSMGRLIRNILLTFAQFEREIAGDRIRDKKHVMKQRGLWTGGDAPLGYDLRRGKLVINPQEAEAVRCIFQTYVREKRLAAAHRELTQQRFRRKVWRAKTGLVRGGNLRHFRGRCFGKLAKHAEVARDLEVGHALGKELGGSLRDWHLIGLVSGVGRQRNVAQVLNG